MARSSTATANRGKSPKLPPGTREAIASNRATTARRRPTVSHHLLLSTSSGIGPTKLPSSLYLRCPCQPLRGLDNAYLVLEQTISGAEAIGSAVRGDDGPAVGPTRLRVGEELDSMNRCVNLDLGQSHYDFSSC